MNKRQEVKVRFKLLQPIFKEVDWVINSTPIRYEKTENTVTFNKGKLDSATIEHIYIKKMCSVTKKEYGDEKTLVCLKIIVGGNFWFVDPETREVI